MPVTYTHKNDCLRDLNTMAAEWTVFLVCSGFKCLNQEHSRALWLGVKGPSHYWNEFLCFTIPTGYIGKKHYSRSACAFVYIDLPCVHSQLSCQLYGCQREQERTRQAPGPVNSCVTYAADRYKQTHSPPRETRLTGMIHLVPLEGGGIISTDRSSPVPGKERWG